MTIQPAEGFTAWPVVAAAMTIIGAYGGVLLTNYVTRRREQTGMKEKHALDQKLAQEKYLQERQASERKNRTELQFISIELIFLLEAFAQKCADVAADDGEWRDQPGKQAERRPVTEMPSLSLDGVSGNWQVIPPWLLYQLHALPVRTQEARTDFFAQTEHMGAYDDVEIFSLRQESFALPGLYAIRLARCLRRLSGYPDTRLADSSWSPLQVMWRVHRRGVSRRAVRRAMEAEIDAGL